MATSVIGLEIAEEAVRAVEVTTGKHPTLLAAGEVMLPPGAAKDSEVLDPDALLLALRQLWSQAGLKSRNVVLGVANRRILVREYVSPRLPPDVLRAALPFEVQDLLPVPVEQAVLDFYPTSETDDSIYGLLVAAVSETIEVMLQSLKQARIRADAVDFLPFGLTRLAPVRDASPDQAIAVASVGAHTTCVVVAVAGVPRFVRMIAVDVVAEEPELPGEEVGPTARRVLENTGRLPAVDPGFSDLVGRLRSTLQFYNSRENALAVSGLYLTGAGAMIPGLGQAVAHGLDVPVRPLQVSDTVALSKQLEKRGTPPPSLINALGVALGGEL